MTNEEFFADWDERTNRFLKHARGVVHIGAHEGQEAPLYAERGLPVVWIEGYYEAYRKLQATVSKYSNQKAYYALLADTDNKLYSFNIANNEGQSSSIFGLEKHAEVWPEVGYVETRQVEAERFDSFLNTASAHFRLTDYNAAVLDVQAAELLVLRGMGDTLSAFDWIRCECADFEIYKGGCEFKDLDDFLEPLGYVIVRKDLARHNAGIGSCYEVLWAKRSVWSALSGTEQDELLRKTAIERECEKAWDQTAPTPALSTISTDGKNNVKVYAAMSSGRLGFQSTGDCIYAGLGRFNIPLGRNEGAFWHHGLQLSIEEGLRLGADFILTLDHDTIFVPEDIAKLVTFLLDNPQIGAAVPLQQRREGGNLLATSSEEVDMSAAGVPIAMGHFGLTLFRREVFEKLSKPWFYEKADPTGSWGNYRVDADMGFWHKCQEAEIWVYLCLDVVVGHLELVATYPDQDLKTKYCNLSQVRSAGFAAPAGVFDRKQASGVRSLNMCTPEELQFPQIKPQEATA